MSTFLISILGFPSNAAGSALVSLHTRARVSVGEIQEVPASGALSVLNLLGPHNYLPQKAVYSHGQCLKDSLTFVLGMSQCYD